MRSALVAGVLVTAVVLSGGARDTGAAGRPTYLPARCSDQSIRPATVAPCGQATRLLLGLRWSRWGRSSATATGTLSTNTCIPDCPSGASRTDLVRVTADRVRRCRNGRRQYTRLRYVPVDAGAVPARRASLPCPG